MKLLLSFVILANSGLVFPSKIWKLTITTSDIYQAGCDSCKMYAYIFGPESGCNTGRLETVGDEFERGQTDIFAGSQIGQCLNFDAGDKFGGQWRLQLDHTGSGGWAGHEARIYLDDNQEVVCNLYDNWLDNTSYRVYNCY